MKTFGKFIETIMLVVHKKKLLQTHFNIDQILYKFEQERKGFLAIKTHYTYAKKMSNSFKVMNDFEVIRTKCKCDIVTHHC